ncbi:MAG: hypothetical protein ACFFAI_12665 [Promethearchaeota archaeon]
MDLNEIYIIEYLIGQDINPGSIAIEIGLCSWDDTESVKESASKRVVYFLKMRWSRAMEEVGIPWSIENLIKFLRSRSLTDSIYLNYLSSTI